VGPRRSSGVESIRIGRRLNNDELTEMIETLAGFVACFSEIPRVVSPALSLDFAN